MNPTRGRPSNAAQRAAYRQAVEELIAQHADEFKERFSVAMSEAGFTSVTETRWVPAATEEPA